MIKLVDMLHGFMKNIKALYGVAGNWYAYVMTVCVDQLAKLVLQPS